MVKKIDQCQVALDARLVDAMRSLEGSGLEIALVMGDKGRLIGTMTDGDIRRALLKGATLESPLAPYCQRQFKSVRPGAARAEVLELMQALTLSEIPIVDQDGKLGGLHLLREMIGSVELPHWAVIMAGGKGTRLLPVTDDLPKPMIPVAGRPILERLVLHLVGHGIRRIFLSINYLGHIIENHFGDGQKFGCKIEYLRESQPLGTGGALALLPETPSNPLIVLNGDLVTMVNFGAMIEFHERGGHAATLGVREYSHVVPFGCVGINAGRIVQFEEKPILTRFINTGLYILEPKLLARVPRQQDFPITNLFEDCLRRGEALGAYEIEDDWIDIGQREQLKLAREGLT
jgi:dTDP-glucose pyrophosphorylase